MNPNDCFEVIDRKRHANSMVSYRDRVSQNYRDRNGKD